MHMFNDSKIVPPPGGGVWTPDLPARPEGQARRHRTRAVAPREGGRDVCYGGTSGGGGEDEDKTPPKKG